MCFSREAHSSLEEETFLLGSVGIESNLIISLLFYLIISKGKGLGVPLWHSRLKIRCCHCSGSGFNPWPGNFHIPQAWPRKQNKTKQKFKRERIGKGDCLLKTRF